VQIALRRGLQARFSQEHKRKILQLLLAEVEQARPAGDADSLRTLAWETLRERLRFQIDPEAVERLAQLEQTPLGPALRQGLAPLSRDGGLELPKDPEARHRLAGFEGNPLKLSAPARRSIGAARGTLAGLLLAATLAAGGWTAKELLDPLPLRPIALEWRAEGPQPAEPYAFIQERLPGGEWGLRYSGQGLPRTLEIDTESGWEPGRDYRLTLVINGAVHRQQWNLLEPAKRLELPSRSTTASSRPPAGRNRTMRAGAGAAAR